MQINFRCDACGRFIPFSDLDNGLATHKLVTPDSAYTYEEYETLCREHSELEKEARG